MFNSKSELQSINYNEAALEYMEKKYGETFEYVSPWGASYTGTHELIVSCDSLPDQEILVQIENYTQDYRTYRDNYIAVKYYQDTLDLLYDCTLNDFDEANVYYNVRHDGLSPELAANASFEEYLADTRVPLVIMIEAKASDYTNDKQIEKISERIAANAARYSLTVVIVDDSMYGMYDRNKLTGQVAFRQFVRCAKINKLTDDIQIEWLEKE